MEKDKVVSWRRIGAPNNAAAKEPPLCATFLPLSPPPRELFRRVRVYQKNYLKNAQPVPESSAPPVKNALYLI